MEDKLLTDIEAFLAETRKPSPTPIKLHPVKSSNIKAVGYDAGRRELWIVFHQAQSRVYVYYGVPEAKALGLMNAASVGQFFHAEIKDRYTDFDTLDIPKTRSKRYKGPRR